MTFAPVLHPLLLALLGAASVQRGPLWWAAHHRHHHVHADTGADLHTPRKGFWRSHAGWFLTHGGFRTDTSRIGDLMRFPELRWLDRYDTAVPVALAALLVYTGFALFDWRENLRLKRLEPHAFRLSLGVSLGVLVFGVLPGILVGVALSVLALLMSTARPRDAVLRRAPPDHRFHDIDEAGVGESPRSATMCRTPAAQYSFATASISSRVASTQVRCAAAAIGVSRWMRATVACVRSRVEPPAP